MKAIMLVELKPMLEKKLHQIEKLGAEVHLSYGEPFIQNHYEYVEVEVSGSYKINGWKFVASLEWDDHSNIVKGVSDIEVPSMYFNRCECDHCNSNRARKHTVLLINEETGEFKQVGKSCLKEFLGINVNSYASYLSYFESFEEYLDSLNNEHIGCAKRVFSVQDILEQAVERIKTNGYITQAMIDRGYEKYGYDYKEPTKTSSDVKHILFEDHNKYGELIVPRYIVSDDTKKIVSEIMDSVNGLEDDSAWRHNIKVLLSRGYASADDIGLVVSAYSAYQMSLEKKESNNSDKPVSEWVGNVGERIEFTARPTCVYSYETEYGYTYIYKFVSGNDVLIWKTSKDLEEAEMTLKATVKDHNEYRGTKQTEITRAKVLSVNRAEKEHEQPTNDVKEAMDCFFESVGL